MLGAVGGLIYSVHHLVFMLYMRVLSESHTSSDWVSTEQSILKVNQRTQEAIKPLFSSSSASHSESVTTHKTISHWSHCTVVL